MQELAKRYHQDLVIRLPSVNFSLKTYAISVHPDDLFLANKPLIISIFQNHLQTLTKTYDGYQDDIEKVEQVQALGAELDADLSGQFYASAIQYLNKKTLVKTHLDSLLQRLSQELNLPHLREILPQNGSFTGLDYSQACYRDLRFKLGLS